MVFSALFLETSFAAILVLKNSSQIRHLGCAIQVYSYQWLQHIYVIACMMLFSGNPINIHVGSKSVMPTDLIVDWIEQRYSQNVAGTSILWVPGSKFMQQRTMWTTIAKHVFMHEFMFRYCRSHCSLLHKFTSGYPKDACSGFIFDAKTGTLLFYPVYYEISGYASSCLRQAGCFSLLQHNS